MNENKTAWITTFNVEPEMVKVIKKTNMQSKIKMIDGSETTVSNERIFEDKETCLKDCIRRNYKHLQVYAQSCADLMDKIKKQEGRLDAERSK